MAVGQRPVTAEELLQNPDDGLRRELVRGEVCIMAPSGSAHGRVAINLAWSLADRVKSQDLGVVSAAETGFKISSESDTVRAPDAAFVRRERIEAVGETEDYWPGATDLAVEAVSPNDRFAEVEKVADWRSAGTRMVLIANPINDLIGDDERWTNPETAMDPSKSIGASREAGELRLVTDELVAALTYESPRLIAATSYEEWHRACLYGRTAAGLLHYHAKMADGSGSRAAQISRLIVQRDTMMSENLRAIATREARRGPTLVFAQNLHLQVRFKVPVVTVRVRVAALGGRRPQPREELSNSRPVRSLGVSLRAADDPAMLIQPCSVPRSYLFDPPPPFLTA